MHRILKLAVPFGLSALALGWTLHHVSFGDLGRALASADYRWFLPAAVVWVATYIARAYRWSLLMGRGPSIGTTLHAQNIGYMLNSTLPFRLGEVARAYVIGERTRVSMPSALSSIIVERILDLATVVAMFAIAAQYVPLPRAFSQAGIIGGTVVLALVALGIVLIAKADLAERALLVPIASRLPPRLSNRLLSGFREVCGGLGAVGGGLRLLLVIVLNLFMWAGVIVFTAFVLRAFVPTDISNSWRWAALVVITSNLGGALPSAPGGLGIVQGFAKLALVAPFQVPEDSALAFVLVWSLGQQLLLIGLGLVSLAALGMTFADVRSRSASATSGNEGASPAGPTS